MHVCWEKPKTLDNPSGRKTNFPPRNNSCALMAVQHMYMCTAGTSHSTSQGRVMPERGPHLMS
jgi:hypothetical protein